MYKFSIFLLLVVGFNKASLLAQPVTDSLLAGVFTTNKNPDFARVVQNAPVYRLQVVYTQINRDKQNNPSFKNYYFNYDPNLYFNPASMVKMPLAFLSLEKLNVIGVEGVNKYTAMQFDSSYAGQKSLYRDTTAENGMPSIGHFIKRAFLISENDPYNRMYQFVGQGEINRVLRSKGYLSSQITRQFMGFGEHQNRHTNPIRFINLNGKVLYNQPAAYNTDSFNFSRKILVGNAYMNASESIIHQPFDFTKHNSVSLEDFQQMLQAVLFPQSVSATKRFSLTGDDRNFLLRYLSQYPSETDYPTYDTSLFYDSYVKFFFRDSTKKMPDNVRVFNKVGWSYGFLTDVSYIVDTQNNVEFMLAATLYTNSDGVINDGKYDYENVGHPFLYQLGQTMYRYELGRKRTFKPKLTYFDLKYTKRNADKKKVIRDVDN